MGFSKVFLSLFYDNGIAVIIKSSSGALDCLPNSGIDLEVDTVALLIVMGSR